LYKNKIFETLKIQIDYDSSEKKEFFFLIPKILKMTSTEKTTCSITWKNLYVGGYPDAHVRVFDQASNLYVDINTASEESSGIPHSVAMNSKYIFTADESNLVRIWDHNGNLVNTLRTGRCPNLSCTETHLLMASVGIDVYSFETTNIHRLSFDNQRFYTALMTGTDVIGLSNNLLIRWKFVYDGVYEWSQIRKLVPNSCHVEVYDMRMANNKIVIQTVNLNFVVNSSTFEIQIDEKWEPSKFRWEYSHEKQKEVRSVL